MTLKLTRLINADGEVVGYFSDHVAAMAARKEWDKSYDESFDYATQTKRCRSIETPIAPAELENVETGDGDRVDYVWSKRDMPCGESIRILSRDWFDRGAASVEVQRFLINRWRRPGMSNRDADLGGPVEAAGVLYVLTVKAPK